MYSDQHEKKNSFPLGMRLSVPPEQCEALEYLAIDEPIAGPPLSIPWPKQSACHTKLVLAEERK